MGGDQHVYVRLPVGYDSSGSTRYPVLYPLHGALGSYTDWVNNGADQIIGRAQMIVVMPYDGYDGSYSDWYGTLPGTSGLAPAWESHHIGELIPRIDANFPTLADRTWRCIAELSAGGGGAMKYAAAHAGLFGAAGSSSGAVDTDLEYPQYPTISEALWGLTDIPGDGPAVSRWQRQPRSIGLKHRGHRYDGV